MLEFSQSRISVILLSLVLIGTLPSLTLASLIEEEMRAMDLSMKSLEDSVSGTFSLEAEQKIEELLLQIRSQLTGNSKAYDIMDRTRVFSRMEAFASQFETWSKSASFSSPRRTLRVLRADLPGLRWHKSFSQRIDELFHPAGVPPAEIALDLRTLSELPKRPPFSAMVMLSIEAEPKIASTIGETLKRTYFMYPDRLLTELGFGTKLAAGELKPLITGEEKLRGSAQKYFEVMFELMLQPPQPDLHPDNQDLLETILVENAKTVGDQMSGALRTLLKKGKIPQARILRLLSAIDSTSSPNEARKTQLDSEILTLIRSGSMGERAEGLRLLVQRNSQWFDELARLAGKSTYVKGIALSLEDKMTPPLKGSAGVDQQIVTRVAADLSLCAVVIEKLTSKSESKVLSKPRRRSRQ